MRKVSFVVVLLIVSFNTGAYAGLFDIIKEGVGLLPKQSLDDDTIVSGLKEALSIGTQNAAKSVSQVDGYFGNEIIKILMPEKIQKVADVLGKVGYQKQVDDFVLSMNRAAEKAAPEAASIFGSAIKEMTLDDARGILDGGDTAATDYFKAKTSGKIYETFKPIISSSMNEVGVTRSYKEMMGKYTSLPFMKSEALDLDHYVTDKSLDGLFYMLGQEEKKIRTNPSDRATGLLKQVFGK
jgi:RNA binding exosome subunit